MRPRKCGSHQAGVEARGQVAATGLFDAVNALQGRQTLVPCFLQSNSHARRGQLLRIVIGAGIVDERRHHRRELRRVELIPRALIHRHGHHQVALTEDSAQALTRVCDLIPGQKAETFEDRADAVELGGHGTRLGVDG